MTKESSPVVVEPQQRVLDRTADTAAGEPCPVLVCIAQHPVRRLVRRGAGTRLQLGRCEIETLALGEGEGRLRPLHAFYAKRIMEALPLSGQVDTDLRLMGMAYGQGMRRTCPCPEGEAVPLPLMVAGPHFVQYFQKRCPRRDMTITPDACGRTVGEGFVLGMESRMQAVREAVPMDTTHVKGTSEALLVGSRQRTGDVDVPRSIEILEISPVVFQRTENGIDDAPDIAYTPLDGLSEGAEIRKTYDVEFGYLQPRLLSESTRKIYFECPLIQLGIVHSEDCQTVFPLRIRVECIGIIRLRAIRISECYRNILQRFGSPDSERDENPFRCLHRFLRNHFQSVFSRTLVRRACQTVDPRNIAFALRIGLCQIRLSLHGITTAIRSILIASAHRGVQQREVASQRVDHIHVRSIAVRCREVESSAALRIEKVRDTHEVEQLLPTGFISFDKGPGKIRNLGIPDSLGAGIEYNHQRIDLPRSIIIRTPHHIPDCKALHLLRVRVPADLVYRIIDLCHQCILSTSSPRKLWLIHSAPPTTSVFCISSS